MKDLMEHAALREMQCNVDGMAMMRWVEDILHQESAGIYCRNYQSVFQGKKIDGSPMLIGGAGRFLGIKVFVSTREITGQIDVLGKPVFTERLSGNYRSMPFREAFHMCSLLQENLRERTGNTFQHVPYVGGVRCITLRKQSQLMVDYYLPEVELFGGGIRMELFLSNESLSVPNIPEKSPIRYTFGTAAIRHNCPDKKDYLDGVEAVIEKIRAGEIQKIIIARRCTVDAGPDFDRLDYAAYLYDQFYQEYFYLFRQGERAYWTGISPSVLLKQEQGKMLSRPLAGSRKRGADERTNLAMCRERLEDPKENGEHEAAVACMQNQLRQANIGKVERTKTRQIFETPYTYHLMSELALQLDKGKTCFDCICALYPPATAWGVPVEACEKLIADTEQYDREYYGGLYGWWNFENDADACVLIRSAKLDKEEVSVYAGGGITVLSSPEDEYAESVSKMQPLLGYFEVRDEMRRAKDSHHDSEEQ